MRKFLPFILFFFCLLACEDGHEQAAPNMTVLGKSFSDGPVKITFESQDSVSFWGYGLSDTLRGKAKYEIDGDRITIENPHGRMIDYEETTESYFYLFTGTIKSGKIYALYQLVGEYGRLNFFGCDQVPFVLTK